MIIKNDKVYDVLKWICSVVLPAICTLLAGLAKIWNWDIPTTSIVCTIMAIDTFIGVITGISSIQYQKEQLDEN